MGHNLTFAFTSSCEEIFYRGQAVPIAYSKAHATGNRGVQTAIMMRFQYLRNAKERDSAPTAAGLGISYNLISFDNKCDKRPF
uniref:Uncharacterized protein n=1 Tax=Candidatus Kentrum sp. FM TaxID=2126340 RepID=A0A450T332_9GAMM|nr:MAG: hypothetical protein BECKFM1743A_GA0114220_102754 [Candidatus Kentron sp. FM]